MIKSMTCAAVAVVVCGVLPCPVNAGFVDLAPRLQASEFSPRAGVTAPTVREMKIVGRNEVAAPGAPAPAKSGTLGGTLHLDGAAMAYDMEPALAPVPLHAVPATAAVTAMTALVPATEFAGVDGNDYIYRYARLDLDAPSG